MAAVAERLVLGSTAATKRQPRVFPNQLTALVDDANEAADE
jgi:hypothetical protein